MENCHVATPVVKDEEKKLFDWMKGCNFFRSLCCKRSMSVKSKTSAAMKQDDISIIDGVDIRNEKSRKMAAYALNLCTVSVSQIVDYNDVHVLEQEYEAILNNLNLENMPKDEALLRTLKQILDTITFFRIQEGDKMMLQKSYEQKVKNAIWNAVPNFGVIVGGSPITMAISLASMIGMGYMNYRREKAKINLENEQQQWQLQRSALEQFNALRRELFDAAWRLADRYNFPDNYRLTEKQISLYDDILMDPVSLRKYQRLWNVREYFEAFPPFWYYLGSAANAVYFEYKEEDAIISEHYKENAKNAFEHFLQIHDLDLLRIDQVRTSCDLEYADILYIEGERGEKILSLIEDAYKHSGRASDVLQLCAVKFVQLEQFDRAQEVLMELIVENSNASTNAYLLNTIYLRQVHQDESLYYVYQNKYNILQAYIPEVNLLPWPSKEELACADNALVIEKKRDEIGNTVEDVVLDLAEGYETKLKKAILYIPPFEQYSDDIYSIEKSTEREMIFNNYIADDGHLREYLQSLRGEPIRLRVYNEVEEFINDLVAFYKQVVIKSCGDDVINNSIEDVANSMRHELSSIVTHEFADNITQMDADLVEHIQKVIDKEDGHEHFSTDYYKKMDAIDIWKLLLESCVGKFDSLVQNDIKHCKEISALTKMREELETFCMVRGIVLHRERCPRPSLTHGNQELIAKFKVDECERIIAHDKQIVEIIKRHQSLIQKNADVIVFFNEDNTIKVDGEILKISKGDYILAYVTKKGNPVLCFTRTGIIANAGKLFGISNDWKMYSYTDISVNNYTISSANDELHLSKDKNLSNDLAKLCIEIVEKFKA